MIDPIQYLTGGQAPRTWSVLVTIFGDMALAEGDRLSGAQLGTLTEPLGIRPEALRTALHRLRKEGWIESTRQGRTTTHALTPMGRTQSEAAVPRIYGHPRSNDLYLRVLAPGETPPDDAYPVAPNLAVTCRATGFTLPLDHLPDWMQEQLCPLPLIVDTNDLADRFETLHRQSFLDPSPSLRILIVHSWRRIALRTPLLPARAFPSAWRGEAAQAELVALLARLPRLTQSTSSTSIP